MNNQEPFTPPPELGATTPNRDEPPVERETEHKYLSIAKWIAHMPCWLFHEFCHLCAIALFWPFVKINKVYFRFAFFETELIINLTSDAKIISQIIILAPLVGWLLMYLLFLHVSPILAVVWCLGLTFSKLGLSEIDERSLKALSQPEAGI